MSARAARGMLRAALLGAAVAVLVVSTACGAEPTLEPEQAAPTVPPVVEVDGPDPVAISIPAIDAHSSLIALGLNDDDTLAVPSLDEPMQAAWYAGRDPAFAGDEWDPGENGPAIISGHVDGRGKAGIFARLRELEEGDVVTVERDRADPVMFEVTGIERVSKDAFPWDRVMAPTAGPELRLITCGGDFNAATGHYEDNWIAWAREVPPT